MRLLDPASPPWPSRVLGVMRIVAALLIIEHGTQKWFGFPAPVPPMQLPPFGMLSALGIASILETIGGFALLIGLLTRPVAFPLSGELAVAYFTVHARRGFYPIQNQGELAIIFCFVFLYFAFAGGGAWSVDAMMGRRGAPRREPDLARRPTPYRVAPEAEAAD